MVRINRPIWSSTWDSLFIPLALLLPKPKAFYCLTVSALVINCRIKNIIMLIFPSTHQPILYDRTKIKPLKTPVIEIGVALNKRKNVTVSAVIKSNYFSFCLASHTN